MFQGDSITQPNTTGHIQKGATLYCDSESGEKLAGSILLPPCCSAFTNLEIPALLPSAYTAENQRPHADLTHGNRSTWIYILHSLRVINLTLVDLLYFAHLLTLLYETLQLSPTKTEAKLFESKKLFFLPYISYKSTDAFNSQFYHRNKSIWWG